MTRVTDDEAEAFANEVLGSPQDGPVQRAYVRPKLGDHVEHCDARDPQRAEYDHGVVVWLSEDMWTARVRWTRAKQVYCEAVNELVVVP